MANVLEGLNSLGNHLDTASEALSIVQKASNLISAWAGDAEAAERANVDIDDLGGGTRGSVIDGITENASLYEQIMPLTKLTANRLTPFIPGRAYFIPTEMPAFLEHNIPQKAALLKKLIVSMATSVEGITDKQVNFSDIQTGNEFNNYEVVQSVTGATRELSLGFPADLDGQPIRKILNYWVTGTYDTGSQRGHYYGAPLIWGQGNHTMSGVYFVLDVKGRMPQYAAYVCNMFPKVVPNSMNNYKRGEHATIEMSIPFACQYIDDHPFATKLANYYIAKINERVAAISTRYDISRIGEIEKNGLLTTASNLVDAAQAVGNIAKTL